MTADILIHNARPFGGAPVDLVIRDGRFGVPGANRPTLEIDAGGQIALPGLVEAHTHLDKTLVGMDWFENRVGPTRNDRILADLQISPVKRLGGLGTRQQQALRTWVDGRFPLPAPREGRSRLLVLAGPTAVGKGTVAAHIRENHPEIHLSVSATTRAPRPGEQEGVHYFFVDDAEFDRMIAEGELLEHATVHNKFRYGTPRKPIEAALAEGKTVLLEIDLQGARQVRAADPSANLVFLLPPSWDELVQRLVGRGTEDAEERTRRLRTAKVELASQSEFDHRVVNEDVATAAREVVELTSDSVR